MCTHARELCAHTRDVNSSSLALLCCVECVVCRTKGLFDWYVEYEQLQPLLDHYGQLTYDAMHAAWTSSHIDTTGDSHASGTEAHTDAPSFPRGALHLLDVGCGNSGLGAEMYKHGWTSQTHIDISSVAIERMFDH